MTAQILFEFIGNPFNAKYRRLLYINGRVLVLLKNKNLTKIVRHFTIDGTVFSSS
jgi:hypothetical protein